MILNGPNKDNELLELALRSGSLINVDSLDEIKQITQLSNDNTSIGIRVNFDLEKYCPCETSVGEEPSRFGICVENGDFNKAIGLCKDHNIRIAGLHMHQSTKSRSLNIFQTLSMKAVDLIHKNDLLDHLDYVDIGGGFFGNRKKTDMPNFDDYAKVITDELKVLLQKKQIQLIIEPGASLVAAPINYMCKVIGVKDVRSKRMVTIDGTLLHINPFLVTRNSEVEIISAGNNLYEEQIVCGSTCMENDRLAVLRDAKRLERGDLISFANCGAYTICYNSCFIQLPPAVYLQNGSGFVKVREPWKTDKLL
jgi:diaminopimelate decarboxylase